MKAVKTMTVEQFHKALRTQQVPSQHLAFICPMCRTVQSAKDLIAAGAGKTFEDVEKYLAFSCVGRWTEAGPARKQPDGKPCDWTLGGFFKLQNLEVVTPDGKRHPRFEPATPEQAQQHMARGRTSGMSTDTPNSSEPSARC